jgi:hypothetical protein
MTRKAMKHDGQRDQRDAEDVGPAVGRRQTGRQQRGKGGARVAGTGDAHGRALMLRRIPARGQRQRGSEGSAGNAEETTEDQHFGIRMHANQPGIAERDEHDHLTDDRRLLRRQAIDENAHDNAQQRTGQHRHRHHQALLGVRQAKILGNADAERSEHDPDHEGQVEIEEGGQQGGRVAGLQE